MATPDKPDPAIHVRVGTPKDIDAAMHVALMACEENGFVAPSPTKLLQELWAALNLHHGICGVIGEPGGPIEAIVLLRVGTMWYADDNNEVLEERAIFVHPDFRSAKGGRAARLCNFSKEAADSLGIPLTIGVLSSSRTVAKIKMYSRLLGPPTGAYWIYGAKTGEFAESAQQVASAGA